MISSHPAMTTDGVFDEPTDDRLLREVERTAEDLAVQAILDVVADRLKSDPTSVMRDYIRVSLQQQTFHPAWMPTSTGANIAQDFAGWIAQACDDREGMLMVTQEGQR